MNDLQMTREGDLYVNNDIAVTDSIEQGIYIRLRWFFAVYDAQRSPFCFRTAVFRSQRPPIFS